MTRRWFLAALTPLAGAGLRGRRPPPADGQPRCPHASRLFDNTWTEVEKIVDGERVIWAVRPDDATLPVQVAKEMRP